MLGPYVGGGLALFGGGFLFTLSSDHTASAWLATHGLTPWQSVFVAVGLPGFLLSAMVLFTVREPARRGLGRAGAADEDDLPSMREVLRELFVRNRFCLPYFAAYVALITLFYAHAAWFPSLLMRKFQLDARTVGELAAPAYMLGRARCSVCGPARRACDRSQCAAPGTGAVHGRRGHTDSCRVCDAADEP